MQKFILAVLFIFVSAARAANYEHERFGKDGVGFFLTVSINGQPRKMMLDTGAFMSVLKEDSASAQLQSQGKLSMLTFANSSVDCDNVSLNDLNFDGYPFASNQAMRCRGSNDLIGANWLDGKVLNLDFNDGIISVEDSTGPFENRLLRGPGRHFMIPATFSGGPKITVMPDTGCSMTAVDSAFVASHPELFVPLGESVQTGFGQINSQSRPSYMMSELRVGKLVLKNLRVITLDLSAEQIRGYIGYKDHLILLGANSLVLANWAFDLKTNTWAAQMR